MGLGDKANSCCHVCPVKPVKNKCANIPSFQILGIIDIPSFQDLRKSLWDLGNRFLSYLHLRRVRLVGSRKNRTPRQTWTNREKFRHISVWTFGGKIPGLGVFWGV